MIRTKILLYYRKNNIKELKNVKGPEMGDGTVGTTSGHLN